jgi:hypothetical protein
MQVDEVGGGDLLWVADFGATFADEIEGWVAEQRAYSEPRCAVQPALTPVPRRGALVWWLVSIDARYSVDLVGERRPAGEPPQQLKGFAKVVLAARGLERGFLPAEFEPGVDLECRYSRVDSSQRSLVCALATATTFA